MDYLDSLEFPVLQLLKLFQVAIDGSQVLVGGESGNVRLFEGTTGLVQEMLRHPDGKWYTVQLRLGSCCLSGWACSMCCGTGSCPFGSASYW